MRFVLAVLITCAVLIAGCGGGGGGASGPPGEVSGIVTDANGNPVVGAGVAVEGGSPSTTSSSNGSYVLSNVPAADVLIRAAIVQNGGRFIGQNLARVFGNERAKSVNIAVYPDNQLGRINGTVLTRNGLRVSGARVFAQGNTRSSTMTITDSNGHYSIADLWSGETYNLLANAEGFDSDTDQASFQAGQTLQADFTLKNVSNPTLPAPQNLTAVAWTSPAEATRGIDAAAFEQIKRISEPRLRSGRGHARTRDTSGGNPIEVDLFWDAVSGNSLLGFGIYRATNGTLAPVDFLRDPLASMFADSDGALQEQTGYTYAITALNTGYPNVPNGESGASNQVSVTPMGDTVATTVLDSPLVFRWRSTTGAETYVVYLFSEFPGIGINSIWDNAGNPTPATQLAYGGSALTAGHTYYWVVVGLANGGSSRSVSAVQNFVKG